MGDSGGGHTQHPLEYVSRNKSLKNKEEDVMEKATGLTMEPFILVHNRQKLHPTDAVAGGRQCGN